MSSFSVSPRVILQLGRESIENDIIALTEIIKNSYDAYSTKCKLSFISNNNSLSDITGVSQIIIEDNGHGMTLDDIQEKWFRIGTENKRDSTKEKDIKDINKKELIRLLDYRNPIGDKGIGRFAINKLGNKVKIITKSIIGDSYEFTIDFNEFMNDNETIEGVKIDLNKSEYVDFLDKSHGTKIIIENLNSEWDEKKLLELNQEYLKLLSPFDKSKNFMIDLDLSRTVFDFQEYTIDSLIENALYKAEFNVYPEDGTYEMSYSFLPYEFMNLSNVNNIIKLKHKMVYKGKKEPQPINLAKYDIGSFSFVIYGFNLGAKILRPLHDRRTIKEYLKKHGGIYVYRELHRVYNYGSNENDWLNLDVARVNRPSEKFSNNTVMGFVKLKKDLSKSLIEKTNREGFIHNQAYLEFRKMVLQMFSDFEISAGKDRKRIEVILSSKKKNINKVNIEDALIKLEEVMLEYEVLSKEEFSNQLSKRISTVKKKYKSMKSLFINTAGKNLGVMMVFHDIEKQLRILIKHGKEEKILDSKFKNLLDSLESLLDFQKVLLSKPRISLHKVDVLVDTFINSIRLRLHDHNISLNRQVDSDLYIKIVENYFYRVLVNLFDNSIYWLKFKGGNKKNILIKAYEDKNFIHILFADNGSGFEDDPNEMVDPLMSRKEDGSGLGLYIVEQITNELNGYLSFPDWEKEKISDIYSNGALIKISIPKK